MKKLIALAMASCLLLAGCSAATESDNVEIVAAEGDVIYEDNTETYMETEVAVENAGEAVNVDDDEVLVITEKLFTEQINYIYYNPDEYIGRTIQYEGMYALYEDIDGNPMDVIYRYGPGCCTDDDVVGFEVIYDGDEVLENDDWVEITGTVEYVSHAGLQYLAINLTDLTVKDERGAETVA